ncbi:MAG: phage major tail tube protein [Ahrensia sp.]|nr:phage major tail tube protein [Ahrensia sp.]
MVQKLGQITNADLMLNGVDIKGRVSEFEMGDIGSTEVEHATLGQIGVLKVPGRPWQAIEGKIAFEWLDEAIERDLMLPTKVHRVQLHSYVDVLVPMVTATAISHAGYPCGFYGDETRRWHSAKRPAIKWSTEHTISIVSFVQKVYGEATPIIELDIFNCIYNINGVPVWHNVLKA